MNWLLWREYRLNRWILAFAIVAILLSYLLGFLLNHYALDDGEDIGGAATFMWSLLTVGLLAGNAIAGERADRSAEFIAYLPLPRWHMLASKLFLHLFVIVALVCVNLLMLNEQIGFKEIGFGLAVCLLIYGVNWFVSSIQSSPALATVSGFATLGLIALAVGTYEDYARTSNGISGLLSTMDGGGAAILCLLPIVCFSFGTWHYLRDGKT